jgi:hypothetical protein
VRERQASDASKGPYLSTRNRHYANLSREEAKYFGRDHCDGGTFAARRVEEHRDEWLNIRSCEHFRNIANRKSDCHDNQECQSGIRRVRYHHRQRHYSGGILYALH